MCPVLYRILAISDSVIRKVYGAPENEQWGRKKRWPTEDGCIRIEADRLKDVKRGWTGVARCWPEDGKKRRSTRVQNWAGLACIKRLM